MIRKALLPLLIASLLLGALTGQRRGRGGPPRRITDPQTIQLTGGGRVEFRTFDAPAVGKQGRYSVLIPPGYDEAADERYPVVYFLHGLNNDHTSWVTDRYGNIPQQLESLMTSGAIPKAFIVHPDGEDGLYTNSLDQRMRWEDFVHDDLVSHIDATFRTRAQRAGRTLGGVSMGAYGSLKIGMKFQEKFAAAAGVSPIVLLGDDPSSQMSSSGSRMAGFMGRLFEPVFGIPFDQGHWKANSLEALAADLPLDGVRLYFSYGTADRYNSVFPMEAGVRRLDALLTTREAGHVFKLYEGEPHGWELVGNHLEEVVGFLTEGF